MASYATPADLLERHRTDTIDQLANDDGARQGPMVLLTNQRVLTALADASGQMDVALVVGKRYTPTNLEGLAGNNLSHRKRICCDLAMAYLLDRNPGYDVDLYERYQKLVRLHLERLQTGEDIFNLDDQLGASLPTIDGPQTADYDRMNLLPERTGGRYYASRATRVPTDRG